MLVSRTDTRVLFVTPSWGLYQWGGLFRYVVMVPLGAHEVRVVRGTSPEVADFTYSVGVIVCKNFVVRFRVSHGISVVTIRGV